MTKNQAYTMFEGVDRLEIITRNSERAVLFAFEVKRDAADGVSTCTHPEQH